MHCLARHSAATTSLCITQISSKISKPKRFRRSSVRMLSPSPQRKSHCCLAIFYIAFVICFPILCAPSLDVAPLRLLSALHKSAQKSLSRNASAVLPYEYSPLYVRLPCGIALALVFACLQTAQFFGFVNIMYVRKRRICAPSDFT